MTTALLAIVVIAVVGTFAWVITRIVNIFVEIENLKEQARNFSERIDNHCKKVNELNEKVKELELARGIMAERMGIADEQIHVLIDTIKAMRDANQPVENKYKCAASKHKKEKKARLVKFCKLRDEGYSIRKAGEAVGVSYVSAKRYNGLYKKQNHETSDC